MGSGRKYQRFLICHCGLFGLPQWQIQGLNLQATQPQGRSSIGWSSRLSIWRLRVRVPSSLPTLVAGWSSLVARRAHNPKVPGSNPGPATILSPRVAQLVEQWTDNPPVGGSIPSSWTSRLPSFLGYGSRRSPWSVQRAPAKIKGV